MNHKPELNAAIDRLQANAQGLAESLPNADDAQEASAQAVTDANLLREAVAR